MSQKVKELYQQLKNGLKAFQESDRWKDYLRFSTKFHHYSFGNTILIWLRKPDATRVAGFRKWHEMGRFVKAGEHGIPIFVPMLYKKKADPAECLNDEQKEEEILRGFRIGYVFDGVPWKLCGENVKIVPWQSHAEPSSLGHERLGDRRLETVPTRDTERYPRKHAGRNESEPGCSNVNYAADWTARVGRPSPLSKGEGSKERCEIA